MNQNDQENIKVVKNFKPVQWLVDKIKSINRRTLVDIIMIGTPIVLIYIYFNLNPSEIKQTLKDNKKIESKVDSLKSDNMFIVERMYELEKKQAMFFELIDQNNNLIRENNKELQKLKRIYNEKINSISSYNTNQLDSFFANRYKEYYNK